MDYQDFFRLSPEEFEAFCHDLFQEVLGHRLEVFGHGPDGGVDLRATLPDGGDLVVQCKHWWRAKGSDLVRHVDSRELAKVRALAPARYLLVTSADLSVHAKDRLYALLRPYVHSTADIYGVRELAAELARHPRVRRRHPALLGVPDAMERKELFERTRDLAEDVRASLRVLVPGYAFPDALSLLDQGHVCVVSGLPGFGKTTIAHGLADAYHQRGFEVLAVTETARQIDRWWDDDERQLFLYDDFLGRTPRDARGQDARHRLLRIVQDVERDASKRLVLTTREYVLAQARVDDELLHDAALDAVTVTLGHSTYDEEMRREIVRRHVAVAALPAEAAETATDPAFLTELARHPGFSPRSVASAVRAVAGGLVPAERLRDELRSAVDDPGLMWGRVLDRLDSAPADLFAVLFSFAEPTALTEVQRAWEALRRHAGRPADTQRFRRAKTVLDRTLIRASLTADASGDQRYALHDPAVTELAIRHLVPRDDVIVALLDSAPYFEQVEGVWDAIAALPSHRPSPLVVERLLAAVRRTWHAAPSRRLRSSPYFRVAVVAGLAESLPGGEVDALLTEVLRTLHVSFAYTPDDEDGGLPLVVQTLLEGEDPRRYDDALVAVLLPAIRAVAPDDEVSVDELATFADEHPLLPAAVRDAVDETVRTALDRALAAEPQDRALVNRLAAVAARRGLPLPAIPWLAQDPRA